MTNVGLDTARRAIASRETIAAEPVVAPSLGLHIAAESSARVSDTPHIGAAPTTTASRVDAAATPTALALQPPSARFRPADALAVPTFPVGLSHEQTRREMLETIDAFGRAIRTSYAQGPWKEAALQWSLDAELERAHAAINAMHPPTRSGFQNAVRGLFASTRDMHVGVTFVGTRGASLPLAIVPADDKLVVGWVDPKAPASLLRIGDIVERLDGRPIADVMADLEHSYTGGNATAARREAAASLTNRRESSLDDLPTAPTATLTVRSSDGVVRDVPLVWQHRTGTDTSVETPFDNDVRRGFVPQLGPYIVPPNAGSKFHSYVYRRPDGARVGYIRVPTFDQETEAGYTRAAAEFRRTIERYRGTTDALVLDMTNNTGGSVRYAYALMQQLAPNGLRAQTDRVKLTASVVDEARKRIDELEKVHTEAEARKVSDQEGLPMTLALAKQELEQQRAVLRDDAAGNVYTAPTYAFGMARIPANRRAYDRPIVALINEGCMSSCDMVASMLRDDDRATIVGVRSAGAGGEVIELEVPSRYGVGKFTLTGSFTTRADGVTPLENLGVTPDVPAPITIDDVRHGFRAYKRTVNDAVTHAIASRRRSQ